jgi:predicted nucleotidyltransferase
MGKIFGWSEVVNDKIPPLDNFTLIGKALRERLKDREEITAALLCGSVVRGDHTIRSDIDCVVVYDASRRTQAFGLMEVLARQAKKYNVPLSFIVCDTAIAASRMHHLGPSFTEHLKRSYRAGGAIAGDVADMLKDSVSKTEEIESYLRFKFYTLEEAWATYVSRSAERQLELLKKTWEAPMHIARKMLAHRGPLAGDGKGVVRSQYAASMPAKLSEPFESFFLSEALYEEELQRQMQGVQSRDSYLFALRHLEQEAPRVLEFIRGNLLHIA